MYHIIIKRKFLYTCVKANEQVSKATYTDKARQYSLTFHSGIEIFDVRWGFSHFMKILKMYSGN